VNITVKRTTYTNYPDVKYGEEGGSGDSFEIYKWPIIFVLIIILILIIIIILFYLKKIKNKKIFL